MTSNKKAGIQLGFLIAIYLVIGGIGGPLLVDYILKVGETNPIIIFVVGVVLVVFIGVGAGIKALAQTVHVTANPIFCYLPVAQDMVVYSVVKGIKSGNSLHDKIKKHNFLLISTTLFIISLLLLAGSPIIFNKILATATASNTEDVATLMVTVNTVINLIVFVTVCIAYVLRVIYFDFIFKLVYKSMPMRILATLPPVHLLLIAILPNQLSYMRKTRAR